MTTTPAEPDSAAPATVRTIEIRPVVLGALASLVVGAILYGLAAAQVAWPDLSGGLALFSYGRVLPMATGLLLYGWLTVTLLAACLHIVPRVTGSDLRLRLFALVGPLLVLAGAVAGSLAVGFGMNDGGRYLEFPLWADGVIALGGLMVALSVTATARAARGGLPVAGYYLVAAPWWFTLAWVTGALPGLGGVPAALQSWFTITALTGLWFGAAGIGIAYYLVGRLDVQFHPRLGVIGFWSLTFTWAWTAGRALQYGPTPDWLETIAVPFAAGAVLAVITIAADFGIALAGRFDETRGSAPIRLVLVGLFLFLLMPLQMLVQAFRGSSTVIHLTAWETAFEQLILFGAFTAWALAFVLDAVTSGRDAGPGRRMTAIGIWLAVGGLGVSVVSRWIAGLQVGYTWVGGVNSDAYQSFGDGFRNSVVPISGLDALNVVGLDLVVIGLIILAVTAVLTMRAPAASDTVDHLFDAPVPATRAGTVLPGAVALFLVASLAVFVLPAIDSSGEASILAEQTRDFADGSLEADGRNLYVQEGCWYCHTQQVRAIVTDVGLGPVSVPGDYAFDDADTLGVIRIGPDLTHVGDRSPTNDPAWVATHLRDPQSVRPWSSMPAYGHLDESELAAIAAYIAALD